MLSIIIVYCDKDKDNLPNLLNQIKERVSVDYEIITISNCTEKDDNATFSFGYNAYQFEARKKALELAKGEFVWFIDGDDEIIALDKIEDVDIAIYEYTVNRDDDFEYQQYQNEDLSLTFENYIKHYVMLWNKIYRKSLFDGFNFTGAKVSAEDFTFSLYAWKKAKTVKTFNKRIYNQNQGYSNLRSVSDVAVIENLFTGCDESMEILSSIATKEEFDFIKNEQLAFYVRFLNYAENELVIKSILDNSIKHFGKEKVEEVLEKSILRLKQKRFITYIMSNYDFDNSFYFTIRATKYNGEKIERKVLKYGTTEEN